MEIPCDSSKMGAKWVLRGYVDHMRGRLFVLFRDPHLGALGLQPEIISLFLVEAADSRRPSAEVKVKASMPGSKAKRCRVRPRGTPGLQLPLSLRGALGFQDGAHPMGPEVGVQLAHVARPQGHLQDALEDQEAQLHGAGAAVHERQGQEPTEGLSTKGRPHLERPGCPEVSALVLVAGQGTPGAVGAQTCRKTMARP